MKTQIQTGKILRVNESNLPLLRSELKRMPMIRKFGRKLAHIGPDYTFSGVTVPGLFWGDYPYIKSLMLEVNRYLGLDFNSCLINHYPAGVATGIGKHKDIEPQLDNIGVVSVSLGIDSDCEFIFRDSKGTAVKSFKLEHRDIFYFTAEDNAMYTHEIPRTVLPRGRISLTFRKFKGNFIV